MQNSVAIVVISHSMILREGLAHLLLRTRFKPLRLPTADYDVHASLDAEPEIFLLCMDDSSMCLSHLVRKIRTRHPQTRIVVLASNHNLELMLEAIELGVSGYLAETVTPDALLKALDVILADGAVFPAASLMRLRALQSSNALDLRATAQFSPAMTVNAALPGLSARELGILNALVLGDSNKLIARKLDIAEATVKVHIKAILRKIRVRNRTQAAIWAMNNGISAEADPHGDVGLGELVAHQTSPPATLNA